MNLDGCPFGTDAEFDDPVRRLRAVAPATFLFGLPPLQVRDLAVDALHPQGMPDPQGPQAFQVGRQVIEHIFDSMPVIHLRIPRMFDLAFDNVGHGRWLS